MDIQDSIAKAIRKRMSENNKTLVELSDETGIPLSSMKKYASGRSNPRADSLELLIDKLGLTPAELIPDLVPGWEQVEITLQAAGRFSRLTPEQQEKGVQLFLELVKLFSEAV